MSRSIRLLVPLLLCLGAAPARADWPLPRADAARTAAARGHGNLRAPVPYWRYYLGGRIGPREALHADLDGDGRGEIAFVAGGKLVAAEAHGHPGDPVLWETPVLGISALVGAHDLDGDGRAELVARTGHGALVVDPASGAVLWAEPGDDLGTLADVRVGDLDGDGHPDLLVQECGCCRINNGNTGFAYGFARGYGAAERLWTLPSVLCGGSLSMAIADLDGDGRAEVTLGERRRIVALDGATGVEVAASPELGDLAGQSRCLPADLDRGGGQELVCLQSSGALPAGEPGHRLYVLGHRPAGPGQPARLAVLWHQDVGETHGQARLGATPVADLDGDGALEIVTSGADASGADAGGTHTTYVHDAVTGAVRATAPGERVVGTVALGPDARSRALVLTTRDERLQAWILDRGALALAWSLPGRRALIEPDWDLAARAHVAERVIALDLTGDQAPELVTAGAVPGAPVLAHDLAAVSENPAAAAPALAATHTLDDAVTVLAAWRTPPLPGQPAALLVARSDGRMHLLDRDLAPAGRSVRFGGYAPRGDWRNLHLTPVTGDLGAGADSVIIRDSRGALVRIDAGGASLAVPPAPRWAVPDAAGPILLAGAQASAGHPVHDAIACWQETPAGTDRVLVLDADGRARWHADLPGAVLSDLVPARLGDAGLPDLVVQWGRAGDIALQHRALDGDTGAALWDAAPRSPGTSRFPAGGAVTDWDADGVDDFVHQYYGTQVLSGVDGAPLAHGGDTSLVHFMPTLRDLDGDARAEVILHGGFAPARALDHDLATPLWVSPDHDLPYPYGAIVDGCADQVPRLVEGSLRHPATLKITPLTGPDAGTHQRLVLAGGRAHPDQDAARGAGAFLGQLTSAAVHTDLTGTGAPVAVVGSEDGWLYAVDGCAAALAFSVPLGAAVGAIAFGDTNGDGLDELLAAAGDGYLYALAEPPVPAPARVIDVDPRIDAAPPLDESADIDTTTARDRVAAAWDPVPGAGAYQVAVVHADSGEVASEPAWQDAGTATRAVITGLALEPGGHYIVAVRALADGAPSPDAASDGVTVDPAAAPEPGGPGAPAEPGPGAPAAGCGCHGADPGAAAWLLLACLGALLARRRTSDERGA